MSLSLPSRIVNVKGLFGHKDFAPISDGAAQSPLPFEPLQVALSL